MKLFSASMITETNTFSPVSTGYEDFAEHGFFRGDGSRNPEKSLFGPLLAIWRKMAEALGEEFVESLCIFAQPGGRTLRAVYEDFRSQILADLESAMPIDVVLLSLHGAMAAESYDDCEGDLLEKVRSICGTECIVGVIVDLHCHLTDAMLRNTDVLIAYKEYPHTDVGERGKELFGLCRQAKLGQIAPTMKAWDCNMLGMWRTTHSPVREYVEYLKSVERREGVLSVSFGHGFPYADVQQVGAKTWAVTNGDEALASAVAREVGEAAIAIRDAGLSLCLPLEQIGDAIRKAPEGLVVIADVADNPGGGASSDATFVLRRFLEEGMDNAVFGLFWDPDAVCACEDAGVGATVELGIGGRFGKYSGEPVTTKARIMKVRKRHVQSGLAGSTSSVGTAAWIRFQGIDLVLTSIRAQPFNPDVFTGLGIELGERRVIVVKSMEHFAAGFGPISSQILYVDSPGALSQDFGNIPYSKRPEDFWPRISEPRGRPFP